MVEQDNVALAALLVSLVAMIITTGQLLQQIFGTGDNYRRVNEQVIGPFSQTRRRVLRLPELRLEITFMTPHFRFQNNGYVDTRKTFELTTADLRSAAGRSSSLHKKELSNSRRIEQWIRTRTRNNNWNRWNLFASRTPQKLRHQAVTAGWLMLIDQIFERERKFSDISKHSTSCVLSTLRAGDLHNPVFSLVEWSWDFLPPDLLRPLASITLGDLLVLCFRLRIKVDQDQLQSAERSFNADGDGHNFSLLNLPGLGLVLQYRFDPSAHHADKLFPANAHFIPTAATDKMAFGIIPENEKLGITEPWDLGGHEYLDSLAAVLTRLKVPREVREGISGHRDLFTDINGKLSVFNQCVGLLCPFLPVPGLGIVKYVSPLRRNQLNNFHWREGRLVFYLRLQKMVNQGNMPAENPTRPPDISNYASVRAWVLAAFGFIESLDPHIFVRHEIVQMFEKNVYDSRGQRRLECLLEIGHAVDEKLSKVLEEYKPFMYSDLVGVHLTNVFNVHKAVQDLRERQIEEEFRDGTNGPHVVRFITECIHRYVDKVDELAEMALTAFKLSRDDDGKETAFEAKRFKADISDCWWLMMLRGCVWEMSHYRVTSDSLPFRSRYYGDSTPVLIA